MPILADILVLLTLVDIFQDNGNAIRSVSRSARAQLLVLFRADLRALLATVAPRGADAAATCCLRDRRRHFEDALGSSGITLVAGEAKRFASVCVTNAELGR